MTTLDFVTEPLFKCAEDDASDVAFVKATHSIGEWDTIEEYRACGLFPLSASFSFGEVEDKETPVSKINLFMPTFPVSRLPDETNDHFCMRVRLLHMEWRTLSMHRRMNHTRVSEERP
jgi:hypothetical protein